MKTLSKLKHKKYQILVLFNLILIFLPIISTYHTIENENGKYQVDLPKAFIQSLEDSEGNINLWHPNLTLSPISLRNHKRKKNKYVSFLQIKESPDMNKLQENGQLALNSPKLSCMCRFIKDLTKIPKIEEDKATIGLPRFKEKDSDTPFQGKLFTDIKGNSSQLNQNMESKESNIHSTKIQISNTEQIHPNPEIEKNQQTSIESQQSKDIDVPIQFLQVGQQMKNEEIPTQPMIQQPQANINNEIQNSVNQKLQQNPSNQNSVQNQYMSPYQAIQSQFQSPDIRNTMINNLQQMLSSLSKPNFGIQEHFEQHNLNYDDIRNKINNDQFSVQDFMKNGNQLLNMMKQNEQQQLNDNFQNQINMNMNQQHQGNLYNNIMQREQQQMMNQNERQIPYQNNQIPLLNNNIPTNNQNINNPQQLSDFQMLQQAMMQQQQNTLQPQVPQQNMFDQIQNLQQQNMRNGNGYINKIYGQQNYNQGMRNQNFQNDFSNFKGNNMDYQNYQNNQLFNQRY